MHKQTAKFIGVVAENLPKMSNSLMQKWIENPKGLKEVLGNALYLPEKNNFFKVWKTINLSMGPKNAYDFRRAIKAKGMKISDYADNLLENLQFDEFLKKVKLTPAGVSVKEANVDLVVVSVADLGFKDGARCRQIYDRAEELGLKLCPPEVGPQLCLQYSFQPKHECLIVGMKPNNGGRFFGLEHDNYGLWLCGVCGRPNYFWAGNRRFIFVLPPESW